MPAQAGIQSLALGPRFRGDERSVLPVLERRHHVLGEPAQLLLELLGRKSLGPVDHELLDTRVLGLTSPHQRTPPLPTHAPRAG